MYNKSQMNGITQKLRTLAQTQWPTLTAFGIVFTFVIGGFLFRLGSLLPGYSSEEVAAYKAAGSLQNIVHHPFDAPYYLLVHCLQYLTPHNLLAVRLASALLGVITIITFCVLIALWHGARTAVIATLVFGGSVWMLHATRYGSPQAMYLLFLPLIACGAWLREKQVGAAAAIAITLSALLMYTPGMAWFLAFGLFLQWPTIDRAFKKHPGAVTLGGTLFLIILAPLGFYFYKHPHAIFDWLLLPTPIWHGASHTLRAIIDVPLALFFRAPSDNPLTWLGRLPILSIFALVMFIAGCFIYAKYIKLARVRLFLSLGILGSIIIGISQSRIPITPIVPLAFAVVAAGIGYVLDTWYKVFPRNPLAQGIGMGLFASVVLLLVVYNTSNYFVAWPEATATRTLFTNKGP